MCLHALDRGHRSAVDETSAPVIEAMRSETIRAAIAAISSGCVIRCSGMRSSRYFAHFLELFAGGHLGLEPRSLRSVSVVPGEIALMRTLCGASSFERPRVKLSSAALAVLPVRNVAAGSAARAADDVHDAAVAPRDHRRHHRPRHADVAQQLQRPGVRDTPSRAASRNGAADGGAGTVDEDVDAPEGLDHVARRCARRPRLGSGRPRWPAPAGPRSRARSRCCAAPGEALARRSRSRPAIATETPSATSCSAHAKPMPALPPVMSAVFPVRPRSMAVASGPRAKPCILRGCEPFCLTWTGPIC